jgi:hypothetical protein
LCQNNKGIVHRFFLFQGWFNPKTSQWLGMHGPTNVQMQRASFFIAWVLPLIRKLVNGVSLPNNFDTKSYLVSRFHWLRIITKVLLCMSFIAWRYKWPSFDVKAR